jgi:cytosine/adenosine deaminase-related metal-dependent hydrolase
MTERRFSGRIFWEGELREGTLYMDDRGLSFDDANDHEATIGTVIPSFINSHTHIGDSFITSEPVGTLSEIVGPGGFKHRMLESASESIIKDHMQKSMDIMVNTGTTTFMDFRESGLNGVSMLKDIEVNSPRKMILGRPGDIEEALNMIESVDGFGMSSISDHDIDLLRELSSICHKKKKIFAIHFSEGYSEDQKIILDLRPDLLVHCLFASEEFLDSARNRNISVSITPRSNAFYGINVDYSRYFRNGLNVLLGTDNCMVASPDIFSEMEFLYIIQRNLNRIDPRQILSSTVDNPRIFLSSKGKQEDRNLIMFPGKLLTEYEIIVRGRYLQKELIS